MFGGVLVREADCEGFASRVFLTSSLLFIAFSPWRLLPRYPAQLQFSIETGIVILLLRVPPASVGSKAPVLMLKLKQLQHQELGILGSLRPSAQLFNIRPKTFLLFLFTTSLLFLFQSPPPPVSHRTSVRSSSCQLSRNNNHLLTLTSNNTDA
jgi:hypothetical protein